MNKVNWNLIVVIINIVPFPINGCFSRTTFNLFMDYMLFMAKILMLDTNKVISVIFEIICINFHLTMIIGRSASSFGW
jgi:hypothetical protein